MLICLGWIGTVVVFEFNYLFEFLFGCVGVCFVWY